MARDPRYVHVHLLTEAIERARPVLRWAIDRAELKGSLIRIDAAGECVFFHVDVSPNVQFDEVTGQACPIAGGEHYELVQVSEMKRAEAEATWREGKERNRQPWWFWVSKHRR